MIPTSEASSRCSFYEFRTDLDKYLGALGPAAKVHSLADVIAFNEAHRDREMPYFGQELIMQAQRKGPLTDKAYRDALATESAAVPQGGDRRGDGQLSLGRAGRADRRSAMDD